MLFPFSFFASLFFFLAATSRLVCSARSHTTTCPHSYTNHIASKSHHHSFSQHEVNYRTLVCSLLFSPFLAFLFFFFFFFSTFVFASIRLFMPCRLINQSIRRDHRYPTTSRAQVCLRVIFLKTTKSYLYAYGGGALLMPLTLSLLPSPPPSLLARALFCV